MGEEVRGARHLSGIYNMGEAFSVSSTLVAYRIDRYISIRTQTQPRIRHMACRDRQNDKPCSSHSRDAACFGISRSDTPSCAGSHANPRFCLNALKAVS